MVAIRTSSIMTVAAVVSFAGPAAPAAAGAQDAPRQTVADRFTTGEPGAPAGRTFAVDFADPANPDGKPPAISKVELELAEGARFDTAAIPRCTATDAQLVAEGAAACPADTRVGTGDITVDTGFPEPGRFVGNDVTYFNAVGELVIFIEPRGTGGRLVLRGKLAGRRLTIDVPPLPGSPPDGGANRRERATFLARGGYLTTPQACPADGFWTNRVTYTYRDGVRQTAESRSPCRAGASAPAGPPSAATPTDPDTLLTIFRPLASARTLNRRRSIGVALRVDGAMTDVRVRLADRRGRTIASATRDELTRDTTVRLRLRRRARPGPHRVIVTAAGGVRVAKEIRLVR